MTAKIEILNFMTDLGIPIHKDHIKPMLATSRQLVLHESTINNALTELVSAGKVRRLYRGVYSAGPKSRD